MKIASIIASVAILIACVPDALAADARPAPVVSLSDTMVTVSNITPGASVALFGASQAIGDSVRLRRWQRVLTDSDRDGSVNLEAGDIVWNSLWIAVDVDSGAVGIAAPPQSRFRRIDFPLPVLRKGQDGRFEQFMTGRRAIDILVVRPHVGAWVGYAADGHESDADQRQNGVSTIVFGDARNLDGNAPAPRHLTHRDVVVAVDLRRLEYYLTEVPQ